MKYLVLQSQNLKDISKFLFKIIQLLTHTNNYINKLCLYLIHFLSDEKQDIIILIFNYIDSKLSKDYSNLLARYTCISLTSILNLNKEISASSFRKSIECLDDSNPILRKLAVISITAYLENNILEESDFEELINKILKDPHPLVFSAGINLLISLDNRDYFNSKIPLFFDYYVDNLDNLSSYYYDKVLFYLTNFSLYFLITKESNVKHTNKFINKLLINLDSCDELKSFSVLSSLNILFKKLIDMGLNDKDLRTKILSSQNISKILEKFIESIKFSSSDVLSFVLLQLLKDFIENISSKSEFRSILVIGFEGEINILKVNFSDKDYISQLKIDISILLISINLNKDDINKKIISNLIKYLSYGIYNICNIYQ